MTRRSAASQAGEFVKLKPLAGVEPAELKRSFDQLAVSLHAASVHGVIRFKLADDAQPQVFTVNPAERVVSAETRDGNVDLEIITRSETWLAIAQGHLAPMDALLQGKMRVRGDHKLGIRIMKRLASGHGRVDIC